MAIPTEIDVWHGDISELEVDAILVPANESLFMTTPVGRAVKLRGGEEVERDAVTQGPAVAGSAVVTAGGGLAAAYVIHVVGVGHELRAEPEALRHALDAALDQAARLGLNRLAAAPIGPERGVFELGEAAAALAEVLQRRAAAGRPIPASLVVAVGTPAEATAYGAALTPLEAGR